MIPILYESNESSFTSNGIHRLIDTISCTVVEERNSIYECDFEYPSNGQYFSEITCGRIIGVKHDDSSDIQPFDIVSFSKPIDGIVTFHAVHISYRLKGYVVTDSNINSLTDALTALASATPSNSFTYSADYTSNGYAGAFNGIPRSVRELLGGVEGSILDTYGGEYEWDKFNVILHQHRGTTVDFAVRYGYNMVDYNDELDYSDSYTSAIPYWVGTDSNNVEVVVIGNKVSSGLTPYNGMEKCISMDLTEQFKTEPTTAELEAFALSKMTGNNVNNPHQSIKVDFVRLQDFSEYREYEELLQCKLCDSIQVIFPDYNTSASFKIVRTEYDVLEERFLSMELGTLSTTLAEALGIENNANYHGSSGGGGGTSNYNDLSNKPSINSVTLSGNKTTNDLSIHDLPSGGSSGQVLSKNSGSDYDVTWITPSSASVTDVKVNGTSVVSSTVANVSVPVKDVTINGSSIVSSYTAVIPKADDDTFGVVEIAPNTTGTNQYLEIIGDGVDESMPILDSVNKIADKYLPSATASSMGAVKIDPMIQSQYAQATFTYGSQYYLTDKEVTVPILEYDSDTQTYDPIKPRYLPIATTSSNGAMSATDKAIVDSIPNGGTSGQVLAKSSGTDYDFTWADNGVTDVKVYGHSVVSSGVANIPKMTGATSSTHGAVGVVPQPLSGEQAKFLFGDGTWDSIWASTANTGIDTFRIDITKHDGNYPSLTQIEIPAATTTKAGIMTAADRTKFNSLSVLPVGSVYESTSSTNPSTDLGNTWTLLGTTDLTSATAIGTSGGDDIVTSEGDTLGFGIVTYKFERTA